MKTAMTNPMKPAGRRDVSVNMTRIIEDVVRFAFFIFIADRREMIGCQYNVQYHPSYH